MKSFEINGKKLTEIGVFLMVAFFVITAFSTESLGVFSAKCFFISALLTLAGLIIYFWDFQNGHGRFETRGELI